jgi:predicted GNAT family N-acyltransferase
LNKDPKYIVQPLGKQDRAAFRSGSRELDSYFLERASRAVRENLSAVFVLVNENDPDTVLGYYTLSSQEIDAGELPAELKKHTGRYERLGATLIGRLAVAQNQQGNDLGELLLLDALQKSLYATSTVAAYAAVVDAKEERVVGFYEKYGFIRLSGNRLFIPMKTVKDLFLNSSRRQK